MELKLKHLAPYLPYGLKCHAMGMHAEESTFDGNPIPIEFTIKGLSPSRVMLLKSGSGFGHEMYYEDTLPILKPLSDLTKEITIDGESFVPIDQIDNHHNFSKLRCDELAIDPTRYPYTVVEWLISLHFDVFALIKAGLAIDINTLK